MVSENFVFRTGKYANKTYEWVNKVNPSYIDWIIENRPEMLREHKTKSSFTDGMTPREKFNALMNNDNFLNEK
jgi:hypothetical protein